MTNETSPSVPPPLPQSVQLPPSRSALEERVRRLERASRWMKVALVALSALAAAPVVLDSLHRGRVPDVLEARKFVVRDQFGIERYRVSLQGDGAVEQTFADDDGHDRIKLGVNESGSARMALVAVTETNKQGGAISLETSAEGLSGVEMFDSQGNPRFMLRSLSNNILTEQFIDQQGNTRVSYYINAAERCGQFFLDDKGTVRMSAATYPNRKAISSLHDIYGKARMQTVSLGDGGVVQVLQDGNAQTKFALNSGYSGKFEQYVEKSALDKMMQAYQVGAALHDVYNWIFN